MAVLLHLFSTPGNLRSHPHSRRSPAFIRRRLLYWPHAAGLVPHRLVGCTTRVTLAVGTRDEEPELEHGVS